MIDRAELEFTLALAEKGIRCEAPAEVMAYLCRRELERMDAPRATVQMLNCLILSDIDNAALRLVGKRVCLVPEVR